MIRGPKYKICRRLGGGIFDKCQTQQFTLSEARHTKSKGRKGAKAASDFGKQLLEKQKVRIAYGVPERQLRRYVAAAQKKGTGADPAELFMRQLETRLDNVIYRAGLANSRPLARQMVSHGHVVVNGRRMTVPSYQVKEGDVFGIRNESKQKPLIQNRKETIKDVRAPAWLAFDVSVFEGSVKTMPQKHAVETVADLGAVLEYYSR